MCIACECAGDECNKRDRSSGLDRGRCSIGFARHGSHPKKSLFDLVLHLRRVEFGEIGLAYFSPPQCEAGHRCKKFFEGGQPRWPRKSGRVSALRLARGNCAKSSRQPGSRPCVAPPKHRSTWCLRRGSSELGGRSPQRTLSGDGQSSDDRQTARRPTRDSGGGVCDGVAGGAGFLGPRSVKGLTRVISAVGWFHLLDVHHPSAGCR